MNKILYSLGLASETRWIDLGQSKEHLCNLMCSNCGQVVHKKINPQICPNCKKELRNRTR